MSVQKLGKTQKEPTLSDKSIADDLQCSRAVEVELIPHLDYPMMDRTLPIRVKAALANYVLRRWNVICSERHFVRTSEYRPWLRNHAALENMGNASIAPDNISWESMRG